MVQMVLCVLLFFGLSFPNGLNCVKNDLTFVIDTTADITPEQFDDVIDFVSNITNKLTIGINNTMVAVVTFNTDPTTQFDLDDYSDRERLLSAINDLKKVTLTGVRNTHLALYHVSNNIFTPADGKRTDVDSVVILITYGVSVSPVQTLFSAFSLSSATLYSIGVGKFVLDSTKTEDLRNVATDPDSDHVFYIESLNYICNNVYNVSSRLDPNVSSVDNCPAIPTTSVTTNKITTEYLAITTTGTTEATSTAEGSTSDTTQTTPTKVLTTATTPQTTSTVGSSTATTNQTTAKVERSTTDTTIQTTPIEGWNTTTTIWTTSTEGSTAASATQKTSTGEMASATTTQTASTAGSTTSTTTQTTSTTDESTTGTTTTHTASVVETTITTTTKLSQSGGGSSQVTVISVSLVLVLLIFIAILIVIYYLPKYRKRKRYLDVIFILVNEYPDIENGLGPSKPRYQEVKHVYKNGHSSKFHSYLKLSIMNNGCKPVSR